MFKKIAAWLMGGKVSKNTSPQKDNTVEHIQEDKADGDRKNDQMQNNPRSSKPAQKKSVGSSSNKSKANAQKGNVTASKGTKRTSTKLGSSTKAGDKLKQSNTPGMHANRSNPGGPPAGGSKGKKGK